jgi:hypothetical protein
MSKKKMAKLFPELIISHVCLQLGSEERERFMGTIKGFVLPTPDEIGRWKKLSKTT